MNNITIASVCDDHYAILLAALIKSIEVNHKNGGKIDYYIVDDHISEKTKSRIIRSIDPNTFQLHWINISDAIPEGMKLPADKSSYPLNIYARLFIASFIPQEIEKVLYLDVDMIVVGDINSLFYTDLEDMPIAAVTDYVVKKLGSPYGGIKNYASLGLDAEGKYLNSGLLLIDTKKWRDEDITQQIIDCVTDNKSYANFPDQYGYNVVLAGRWKELDPRWNFFVNAPEDEAPYLIHFIHRKPIYKSYPYSDRYRDIFYKYVRLTEFKNDRPIGEPFRYIKKIGNILQKLW